MHDWLTRTCRNLSCACPGSYQIQQSIPSERQRRELWASHLGMHSDGSKWVTELRIKEDAMSLSLLGYQLVHLLMASSRLTSREVFR